MVLLDILSIGQNILYRAVLSLCIINITITTSIVILSHTIIVILTSRNIRIADIKFIAKSCQWFPDILEVNLCVSIQIYIPTTTLMILIDILHRVKEEGLGVHRILYIIAFVILNLGIG